jgi:hypothetical protein
LPLLWVPHKTACARLLRALPLLCGMPLIPYRTQTTWPSRQVRWGQRTSEENVPVCQRSLFDEWKARISTRSSSRCDLLDRPRLLGPGHRQRSSCPVSRRGAGSAPASPRRQRQRSLLACPSEGRIPRTWHCGVLRSRPWYGDRGDDPPAALKATSGYPRTPLVKMPSHPQRVTPVSFSSIRALTSFFTRAAGSGLAAEKRIVPLEVS